MKKIIITGEKAKEQLLEGAKLLYEAVSTTLGPKGQNGVIQAYGEPIVTHDGVTVAKSIENVEGLSPGGQVGIEMIKSSSSKTNDNVGDGTTSSTIIAYSLIDGGMRVIDNYNPMVLRRELDEAAKLALKELDELSMPIQTEKEAIEVATISSENHEIGKEVGKMYHTLGKDGMVVVEIGNKPYIEYEIVEGYTIDRGFINPMQITDPRTQSTTLKDPAILVAHNTLALKDVAHLLDEAFQAGKSSFVIVCNDFKNDLLEEALSSIQTDMLIVGIKAPGFGDNRAELLRDFAAITGTVAVGNNLPKKVANLTLKDLGTCEEIVITTKETVVTGGADVSEHIKELEGKLKNTESENDKSKIEKRLGQLRAKVGQIRVGGNTEMEAEERKYLVDDAVAATEAALKEGIVPGGGTTYIEIARRLPENTEGEKLLKSALSAPFKVLMQNAGLKSGVKMEELTDFGMGFDVMGNPDELVDMKEHGIIDPALVIRQAIINATSVAGSALTTGVLILNKKEKEDGKEDE